MPILVGETLILGLIERTTVALQLLCDLHCGLLPDHVLLHFNSKYRGTGQPDVAEG